ncbi:hypothetical protein [Flavonifractor plautii]
MKENIFTNIDGAVIL